MGTYDPAIHFDWIEKRKQALRKEKYADDSRVSDTDIILYKDDKELKELLQSIWPEFDETRRSKPSQADDDDYDVYGYAFQMNRPRVQFPVIRYLHEKELGRIIQRIQELEPHCENPVISGIYKFNQLSKQVIEAWFLENKQGMPPIDLPEEQLGKGVVPFRLDEDARTAIKGGIEYPLTPNQFKVVSFLYEALTQGDPWKSFYAIKKHTGIGAGKMYEVFRDNKPVWKDLIEHPLGKRKYCLKV